MARFRNSFYHCFLVMGSLFDTCASLSELLYSSHVMTQSVESCTTFPSKEQEALCGGGGKRILLPLLGCFVYKAIVLSGLERNDLNTVLAAKPLLPWKVVFPQQYWNHFNMSTLNTWTILTRGRVIFCWVSSFMLYWIHLLADQQIHQVILQQSDTETWPQVWYQAKRSSLLLYRGKTKIQVSRSVLSPWLTPHVVQTKH